jgi:hypothetical protein
VFEWHQARDNKGGTVKIMLFEQEQLGVPDIRETQTGAPTGECGAPRGMDWLPETLRPRTGSLKTVPLERAYFVRYIDRHQVFEVGVRPVAGADAITQRVWRQHLVAAGRKHPIAVGDLYLAAARLPSLRTLSRVAAHFGVSTASVSQHVALIRRLPGSFVNWYREVDDVRVLAALSERRLRPLTQVRDPVAQQARLRELLEAVVPPPPSEDVRVRRIVGERGDRHLDRAFPSARPRH